MRTDPDCATNLSDRAEFAGRKAALRKRMETQLAAEGDLRSSDRGRECEAHPYARRDHVRYYERFAAGEKVGAGWISPGNPDSAFYAAAPHIRRFEWVPDPSGPRRMWDVSGQSLDRMPTVLRIDLDIRFLTADAGENLAVGDAAEWVLTALNSAGTNRATAKKARSLIWAVRPSAPRASVGIGAAPRGRSATRRSCANLRGNDRTSTVVKFSETAEHFDANHGADD